jgi:hypothetical protein
MQNPLAISNLVSYPRKEAALLSTSPMGLMGAQYLYSSWGEDSTNKMDGRLKIENLVTLFKFPFHPIWS